MARTYMSANVIYYDGLYYLFMACKNQEEKPEYKGIYDLNSNGREDRFDMNVLMDKIVE